MLEALLAPARRRGPARRRAWSSATSTPTRRWQRAFFAIIPVVELGDRRLELATSPAALRRLLADVLDAEPVDA